MIAPDVFMQGQVNPPPRDRGLLLGPADANHFRVKVGRYGDRWYHDPLDGDEIAPATEWVGPSISTCKKASGNDWSFVALKRVNEALVDRPERFAKMGAAERYEALKAINKLGLAAAGQRGTNVHLMAEDRLYERTSAIGPEGANYREAVDQFFDAYQPKLIAAEFVCIHRTLNRVGYGGTCDAILEITSTTGEAKRFIVDWKSRGEDSEHGAYPEEAAQVAAYGRAEYMIVEGDTGPERRQIPELDGGLIISIKPDGCRVYPIDLDKGFQHWTALHAWWVARRDEREAIGHTWTPRKIVPGPGSPAPNEGTTGPGTATGDATACPSPVAPSTRALGFLDRPAVVPPPALVIDRDEGSTQGLDDAFDALQAEYQTLDDDSKVWMAALRAQAQRHGVDFHSHGHRSERRWWLIKALTVLAAAGLAEDEVLRALVALVADDEACLWPAIDAGYALGSLGARQAARLGNAVDALVGERLEGYVGDDTVFRVRRKVAAVVG